MKTQEITVTIKATVPVGDMCDCVFTGKKCESLYHTATDEEVICCTFNRLLKTTRSKYNDTIYIEAFKCQQCLDACKEKPIADVSELFGAGKNCWDSDEEFEEWLKTLRQMRGGDDGTERA